MLFTPFYLPFFFFFNDTATTEIYTLSLHDALPISCGFGLRQVVNRLADPPQGVSARAALTGRSEEHTSELQSHLNLVCRLLLEKKKFATIESCFRRCRRVCIVRVYRRPDEHMYNTQ